ncbi:hypothetical protein [Curtobacterium sp. Leaf261]|uniref:hypothetical protein n=1 Tax=Curtobacterium sp. Leaf261 TaxID=1736311 RepID=UPI0006FB8BF7|nr:hypothetical protein [Curtobacterium sp. Leaf261]KQO62724.1 hypothetical protein ASF23_07105 [Curtobacterium sp. Leaf261]
MAFALHRWTRETLLARLEASDAIDDAAEVDVATAARDRLRLLGIGDRLEAHALTDDEAIAAFHSLRDEAHAVVPEQVRAD